MNIGIEVDLRLLDLWSFGPKKLCVPETDEFSKAIFFIGSRDRIKWFPKIFISRLAWVSE